MVHLLTNRKLNIYNIVNFINDEAAQLASKNSICTHIPFPECINMARICGLIDNVYSISMQALFQAYGH